MTRLKKDGTLWDWGETDCLRCGFHFKKIAPRSSYCDSCRKINILERERDRYISVCGGASVLEIQKRTVAAREARLAGIELMHFFDVLDGLKKDKEVSEFISEITPMLEKIKPVKEKRQKRKRMTIRNRRVDEIFNGEVLFILRHNDLEREVVRRLGQLVANKEVDEIHKNAKVVFMEVDEETWQEEPLRL